MTVSASFHTSCPPPPLPQQNGLPTSIPSPIKSLDEIDEHNRILTKRLLPVALFFVAFATVMSVLILYMDNTGNQAPVNCNFTRITEYIICSLKASTIYFESQQGHGTEWNITRRSTVDNVFKRSGTVSSDWNPSQTAGVSGGNSTRYWLCFKIVELQGTNNCKALFSHI